MAMAQDVEPVIILEERRSRSGRGPLAVQGRDWKRPISVEDYPEVVVVDDDGPTTLKSTPPVTSPIELVDLDDYDDEDDVVVLEGWKGKVPVSRFRRKPRKSVRCVPFSKITVFEIGESSSCNVDQSVPHPPSPSPSPPPSIFCVICMEPKELSESFGMSGCTHVFCSDCITHYIAAKIEDNVSKIVCPDPDCKNGYLEPERCHPILPSEVFERWCSILVESLLLNSAGLYCPFKDCSAPLLNEGDGVCSSSVDIRETECPYCWRLFCARCKVPWHADFTCEAFQKLSVDERGQEDIMLMNMAKNKKWQRCPKCKIFVERTQGCMFMKCRCGYTFCYGCGTEMTVDHYCQKCRR